ncbi:uncharacterized protein LOC142494316 [Ascaphus truei]|uniref:uncharacterized protein LOC142494316 n=1 Tax=Ascaphus truei TaxID=8439 RepID=UPI003F599C3E
MKLLIDFRDTKVKELEIEIDAIQVSLKPYCDTEEFKEFDEKTSKRVMTFEKEVIERKDSKLSRDKDDYATNKVIGVLKLPLEAPPPLPQAVDIRSSRWNLFQKTSREETPLMCRIQNTKTGKENKRERRGQTLPSLGPRGPKQTNWSGKKRSRGVRAGRVVQRKKENRRRIALPTVTNIINLSSSPLSIHETSLLERGLSFAPNTGPNAFQLFIDLNNFIRKLTLKRYYNIQETNAKITNPVSIFNTQEEICIEALTSLLRESGSTSGSQEHIDNFELSIHPISSLDIDLEEDLSIMHSPFRPSCACYKGLKTWLASWKERGWKPIRGGPEIWEELWTAGNTWTINIGHVDAHLQEGGPNGNADALAKVAETQMLDLVLLNLANWAHETAGQRGMQATYEWTQWWGLPITLDMLMDVQN